MSETTRSGYGSVGYWMFFERPAASSYLGLRGRTNKATETFTGRSSPDRTRGAEPEYKVGRFRPHTERGVRSEGGVWCEATRKRPCLATAAAPSGTQQGMACLSQVLFCATAQALGARSDPLSPATSSLEETCRVVRTARRGGSSDCHERGETQMACGQASRAASQHFAQERGRPQGDRPGRLPVVLAGWSDRLR